MNNRKARWRRPARTDPNGIQTEAPPNNHKAGSGKDHQSARAKIDTAPRAEAPVMRRALPGRAFTPRVMTPGYSGFLEWGQIFWSTCP